MKRPANIVFVLCALAAIVMTTRVRADEERPFKLSAVATYVGSFQEGRLLIGVFELQGNATHVGNFTGIGLVEYPPPDRLPTGGILTLESKDGDTLVVRTQSAYGPDTGAATGIYVITDGSGKFAEATGDGYSLAANSEPGVVNVELDGTISF
jgi:hypothetical protein